MGKKRSHKGMIKGFGTRVTKQSTNLFVDFHDGNRIDLPNDREVLIEFEESKMEERKR